MIKRFSLFLFLILINQQGLANCFETLTFFDSNIKEVFTYSREDSAGRAKRITLKDGTMGIYKNESNFHTFIEAEVLAYELSKLFDFITIPKTRFVHMLEEKGSFQDFIVADPIENANQISELEWAYLRAFDHLIDNHDRHIGNLLRKKNGDLILIDHSKAFGGKEILSISSPDNALPDFLFVKDKLDQLTGLDKIRVDEYFQFFSTKEGKTFMEVASNIEHLKGEIIEELIGVRKYRELIYRRDNMMKFYQAYKEKKGQ
ncbi:hypothetical protein HBN50_10515 [Halobacteriovorax sp. GB3]|uniref:hypothetical protein n=1 Tax=Halobacteriovorax sp. GB3 TaxID=2719615 RepID=UPI00235FC559|nr:hypothetical protein [Halobacteriovorax sp. GB3]MDD0853534.1 hypothetical protein [Halobacteriovorax sp. GB3]